MRLDRRFCLHVPLGICEFALLMNILKLLTPAEGNLPDCVRFLFVISELITLQPLDV